MEVIDTYLNSMFAPYQATAPLLEAKEELRQMMDDAYQAAIDQGLSTNAAVGKVITEFGDLQEVAPVLGITSYLNAPTAEPESDGPVVTLEEAQNYSQAVFRNRWTLTIAISLFILSPATLIVLASSNASSPASTTVGVVILLLMVAAGVSMLVQRSGQLAPFQRLVQGRFSISPEVSAWATAQSLTYAAQRTRATAIAITIWILSALPVIIAGLFSDTQSDPGLFAGIGVALTLLIVAVGFYVILPSQWSKTVEDTLLKQQGDDEEAETSSPVGRAILGAYWPIVVAIYLGWSFWTNDWHITWIVFPVAGLAFAALAAFFQALWPSKQ